MAAGENYSRGSDETAGHEAKHILQKSKEGEVNERTRSLYFGFRGDLGDRLRHRSGGRHLHRIKMIPVAIAELFAQGAALAVSVYLLWKKGK